MKRHWLPRRLLPQLLLLFSGVLLVSIVLHAAFTLRAQLLMSRSTIELGADALVRNLAVATAGPLVLDSLDEIESALTRAAEFPGVLELQVSDASGRILSHVRQGPDRRVRSIIEGPGRRITVPESKAPRVATEVVDGREHLIAWYPIVGGKLIGWIRGEFSTDVLDDIRRRIWITTLGATVLALSVGGLMLYMLLRRSTRALVRARRFAVMLDSSHGRQLPVMPASEEVEDLQASLNYASANLHQQQQQLSATIDRLRYKESALADRNEQLDAIFTLSPDGFVSFDAARRVKYASPAFLSMTGFVESDVIGLDEAEFSRRLSSACVPGAAFPGVEVLRADLAGEAARRAAGLDHASADEPLRRTIELAGPGRRVLETGLRISGQETVSQILYFRDVTHATEVEQLKSEFLATAAHELRTPLASIYGYSELLLAQDFDDETRTHLLKTIHSETALIAGIVNELLDLARIEARRGKDFVLESISLQELVGDVVAGFKPVDGRDAPVVEPLGGSRRIHVDRKKMRQALLNVVSNAYKYSPRGGAIEIRYRQDGAGRCGITVRDHGIGMTPEQLARVCERFYRADTSGRFPGTGLGMSIVKEIVALHGGELQLESVPGQGSTVTLWLPAAA